VAEHFAELSDQAGNCGRPRFLPGKLRAYFACPAERRRPVSHGRFHGASPPLSDFNVASPHRNHEPACLFLFEGAKQQLPEAALPAHEHGRPGDDGFHTHESEALGTRWH
jgi:hypothetical protein